jgi:hypothetical protein
MTSDFCGQVYIFYAVDCKQIFASPTIVDAVKFFLLITTINEPMAFEALY